MINGFIIFLWIKFPYFYLRRNIQNLAATFFLAHTGFCHQKLPVSLRDFLSCQSQDDGIHSTLSKEALHRHLPKHHKNFLRNKFCRPTTLVHSQKPLDHMHEFLRLFKKRFNYCNRRCHSHIICFGLEGKSPHSKSLTFQILPVTL